MSYIIDIWRGSKQKRSQMVTLAYPPMETTAEWKLLGRSLIHQGLVTETTDGYPVLKLNAASWEVLRKQAPVSQKKVEFETLFEILHGLRKQVADEPLYGLC